MLTGCAQAVERQNSFAIDFFFQVLLSSQNVANGCNAASKAVPW